GRGVAAAASPGEVGYALLVEPAVLPPAPLGALAIGQGDLLANIYTLNARGAHQFVMQPALDNSLRLALGNFDLAFVVVWLLPLIVIALTFNVVCGERERGVLALAVACGAALQRFVLGKIAARAVVIQAAVWIALLAAGFVAARPLQNFDGIIAWFLWSAIAALYAAFWTALGLWVNASERGSDINAALLVGCWLLTVIVAPTVTNLAATTLFPAPSRVELTTALREATESADRLAAAQRDRYFFDHPELQGKDSDKALFYRTVAAAEANIEAAMQPLLAQFAQQAQRQRRLVAGLQYLSPGTLAYETLTALSGSNGVRHAHFRAQVFEFHRAWVAWFRARLDAGQRLTPADYDRLPRFSFSDLPLAAQLRQLVLPAVVLAALTVALFWSALRRLRRLTVV
ncbi:MAG: DUF3526 domain-containing protein, partial [Steroidobacteraceae bacterium]|nr:DUF3526 domain-containing protein [Steroidobacteraceae bacterium]